jgi:hypothetical protein
MVAFYENNFQVSVIVSPFQKKLKFFIGFAMEHVAHNNELTGLKC